MTKEEHKKATELGIEFIDLYKKEISKNINVDLDQFIDEFNNNKL